MTPNSNPIIPLLVFFCLSHLALLISSAEDEKDANCPPFNCGKLDEIRFPFSDVTKPECYGLYKVDCRNKDHPKIQLKDRGHWYEVKKISQANSITIIKDDHQKIPRSCEFNESFALPFRSPVSNLTTSNDAVVMKCNHSVVPTGFQNKTPCGDYDLFFYTNFNFTSSNLTVARQCALLPVPKHDNFTVEVHLNPHCYGCATMGGKCLSNLEKNEFKCSKNMNKKKDKKPKLKLALGLGFSLGVLICLIAGFFLRRRCVQRRKAQLSRNVSDPLDPEAGSVYYGIPLFTYKDLQEATSNFDSEKELGDGGFGTVYHGVLKDGRQVAVKRLYEHNYRRVEQFVNEVEILTRLRHRNLVTLYGCTSRRSRELLLVYEYIPNGTVADHLHGDRDPLSWPVRLSIAVETATALAYLHASETVHRDVKTNNILLDANFCVKVADFGLSRLFPSDVTHVSTAPQGTPGYVDPDYHQCYQLTSKSDVYSFGVVLVELVSSMPAVDITRHRHEINLASLAISKIGKRAYGELVDPGIGFDSDPEARKAIMAVSELAFQCLQQDKEMRPTMEEVLRELRRIESGDGDGDSSAVSLSFPPPPPSPECDEDRLLKNENEEPPSPNTVTENWHSSRSITPNTSSSSS